MKHRIDRSLAADRKGFTLIEVLITLVLAGVVMTAIYSVFISSNHSYRTQDNVADAQQRVRTGLDFMSDDMRMAGMDPLRSASAGIESATATSLRFTSDVDLNGVIDSPLNQERITYAYDAANRVLRRGLYEGTADETWETLIDNVSALTFTYLDSSGNPTAVVADTRSILVSLSCEGVDARGKGFSRTLSTRIIIRNLNLG